MKKLLLLSYILGLLLLSACAIMGSGETPTPMPTIPVTIVAPTPTLVAPSPTLEAPATGTTVAAYAPLLETTITRPPADMPPLPPPVWQGGSDPVTWWRDTIRALTDLVNWAGGDTTAITSHIQGWGHLPSQFGTGQAAPPIWVETVDLDQDGVPELILSAPRLVDVCEGNECRRGIQCDFAACQGLVLVFTGANGLFVPVYHLQPFVESDWLDQPQLFRVEDINDDGLLEVLVSEAYCGAHTCSQSLHAGQWDGQAWRDLGSMGQQTTEISLTDWSGDGLQEIVFYGGLVGSAGAGLQRPHTLVYGWEGGRYQLIADVPDPDNHPYYLMLDAHTALANGDLATALMLAEQAAAPVAGEYMLLDEWSRPRIGAYAGILAMLAHGRLQETNEMEALLYTIETTYATPANPYVPAARALWQNYQERSDLLSACQAMAAVVQAAPDQASFFEWIGYNTETIAPENMCPLDEQSTVNNS